MKLAYLALLAFALPAAAQINCPSGFNSPGFGNGGASKVCGVNTVPYPAGQPFGADSSNGNISGSNIILIPYPGGHAASSLIYQTPVNVQSFTTTFTFIPDGKNIALAWNNTTNQQGFEGYEFDGGAGCEAGFYQAFTNPEINNIFALELDSSSALSLSVGYPYAFTYTSAQIYTAQQSPCIPPYTGSDGKVDPTPDKISTYPVALGRAANSTTAPASPDTYSATVTYDGSNLTLYLYDVTAKGTCTPATSATCFTHTWTNVNIPAAVGGSTAYVGLTGGTNGDNFSPLVISSLVYTAGSAPPPPPPVTTVATPTFSVATGTYTSAQTVTISDTTSGSTIFYSISGATAQVYSGSILVSSSETITAYATATGDTQSATATAVYTINIPPPPPVTTTLSIPAQTIPITIQTGGTSIAGTITIPAQTVTLP